ncbi:MAG: methyltransferase [Deltaproteobacteria bacterium]|nr:methyltransferase [Deltaproteobacteria bacterium]
MGKKESTPIDLRYIEANTCIASPPLCPELKLHLLKEGAPLNHAAPLWRGKPQLFAWHGPRPYWAFAWASGQALARFVLDHREVVRGKRVVDFGAGSGIGAIAAASGGATAVTAYDVDPAAIQAIQLNSRLNNVAVLTSEENLAQRNRHDWDVLLAGDVFYHGGDPHWLIDLAPQGKLILIGDPPIRGFPKEYLRELARYTARTFPELEDPSMEEACVYAVLTRSSPQSEQFAA